MKSSESICQWLEQYFDRELNSEEISRFSDHLETCDGCRKKLTLLIAVRKSLLTALDTALPDDADLKIRKKLRAEMLPDPLPNDILDIDDVAGLLKIPVSELITIIDLLPGFEVAGRLRFRRDRIMDWIRQREPELAGKRMASDRKPKDKLISFPGGIQ
jgi:anti-sigma factor RsiW